MSQRSHTEVYQLWQQMCQELQSNLSPAVYNTWIISNPLHSWNDLSDQQAEAVFLCPSAFHATNLQKNLTTQLEQALFKVSGKVVALSFEVGVSNTSTPPQTKAAQAAISAQVRPATPTIAPTPKKLTTTQPQSGQSQTNSESLFSPEALQLSAQQRVAHIAKRAGLRPDHTFTTFAVSTTNELAHAAATAVSKTPGSAYNPLFLYGGVGVGKTHLMQAIGNNLLGQNEQAVVIYCTGEEFTNEIVSAIQTKKALQFKAKYRVADILLIDDVQFIAGKNAVQEEFFHTFNAVVKRQGQVVLTSDRPPHEINLLEDRLRSRFEAGLMVDIQEPSFELRTAILLIKAQANQVVLPMDLAQQIASQVSSARRLEGIVKTIRSEVELKNRVLNQELVNEILKQDLPAVFISRLRVKPDQVIKTVANHYHIKQTVLKGEKRHKSVVRARHVAMYILKNDLELPYIEIGRWFSNRDHTSVMHAVSKISEVLTQDQILDQEISAIRTSLSAISR